MIQYPDYNNSLVNLACSILKHYKAPYQHKTLPLMDTLLAKNYKNVVVILLDGMGVDALERHLPEESFLRSHMRARISSVFPPTTTAATTTLETGLTPAEHGWLGWCLYFPEIDKSVNAFMNTLKDSYTVAENYHVATKYLPYTSIYDKINETGKAKAYSVSPFGSNKVANHVEMFTEVKRLCEEEGSKYIYAYATEPDNTMHDTGCDSEDTRKWCAELNYRVEEMCKVIGNTLLIVTADHGHCNLRHYRLSDYPDLMKMLIRPTSIETRAISFFVKEEYLDGFADEFNKYFGEEFLLFPKQEVIRRELFGDGERHPKFDDMIGDFLAVAIADAEIVQDRKSKQFVSSHAGLTKQEMEVPFIVVELQ